MFTGIITDIGHIIACERSEKDTHLKLQTAFDMNTVALGASIACNGICLTVTGTGEDWFSVTASAETMRVTTLSHWQKGDAINLERSLCLGDEVGGHLVSGHVDGVATLKKIEIAGETHILTLEAPDRLLPFIALKGSVTLDGISLTVSNVSASLFTIHTVPYTWHHTNLHHRKAGDVVNLEIDMLARYVERIMQTEHRYG